MDWDLVIGGGALIPLVNAGIRLALPTALAAVGEAFSERAGTLNLGLEGIMLSGALAGFLGAHYSASIWLGVLLGMGTGLVLGALMAFLVVGLKTDQVISGIALLFVGQGLTLFVFGRVFGASESPALVDPPASLDIPLLSDIPGLGAVLFNQNGLFYVGIGLVALVAFTLYRTRLGLWMRAAGERPDALDAAGISVDRLRVLGLLVSGTMAGLGGAVVVLELGRFVPGITAGRGWVAIALVIFGRWNPMWVFGGALLFGLLTALQLRVQAAAGGIETDIPYEIFQALPYVVTIIVMVVATILGKRDAQPAALGTPFLKEARVE